MAVDGGDPFGDFADAARKFPRRELSLTAQDKQAPAHLRNDDQLHSNDARGNQAKPLVLDDDEKQCCRRLAAKQERLHEGIADETAQRLHLVLDHCRQFGGFGAFELAGRKTQDAVDQVKAHAPQHAFAEAALVGIDVELEGAVDDNQQEKNHAEINQRAEAIEFEARRNFELAQEGQGNRQF